MPGEPPSLSQAIHDIAMKPSVPSTSATSLRCWAQTWVTGQLRCLSGKFLQALSSVGRSECLIGCLSVDWLSVGRSLGQLDSFLDRLEGVWAQNGLPERESG